MNNYFSGKGEWLSQNFVYVNSEIRAENERRLNVELILNYAAREDLVLCNTGFFSGKGLVYWY